MYLLLNLVVAGVGLATAAGSKRPVLSKNMETGVSQACVQSIGDRADGFLPVKEMPFDDCKKTVEYLYGTRPFRPLLDCHGSQMSTERKMFFCPKLFLRNYFSLQISSMHIKKAMQKGIYKTRSKKVKNHLVLQKFRNLPTLKHQQVIRKYL